MTPPTDRAEPPSEGFNNLALTCILAAQATWLFLLARRGWYYQDDFTFLADATGRTFDWSYLSAPLNGHFVPGLRAAFWLMQHYFPLNHGLTIAVRCALQALATALVYRLARGLCRSAFKGLVVTACYASSPILIPGSLWLSSSVNLLPSQVLIICCYLAHLAYQRHGRLRSALISGICLVLATAFWEKSAVTAFLLPLLSVGVVGTGSIKSRLGQLLRQWRGWLLTYLPLVGYVVYFVTGGYGSAARSAGLAAGPRVSVQQWVDSLWPSVLGGPWHWFATGDSYASVSSSYMVLRILGQVACVVLVVTAWRRMRWNGLAAVAIPAVSVLVGMSLVSAGRYAFFGDLIAMAYSYLFDLAVPMVITISTVWGAAPALTARSRGALPIKLFPVTVAVLVVSSSLLSALTWTSRWAKSPARTYVTNLLAQIDANHGMLSLYDSTVPQSVVPYVNGHRHVSDLLQLAHRRAQFGGTVTQPQLVDDTGHVRPATFFPVGAIAENPKEFCSNPLQGAATIVRALHGSIAENEYFLRIAYFQQRPTTVTLTVRDRYGSVISPASNATILLDQSLGTAIVRLTAGVPATITISSTNSATNLCISDAAVGVPFSSG